MNILLPGTGEETGTTDCNKPLDLINWIFEEKWSS